MNSPISSLKAQLPQLQRTASLSQRKATILLYAPARWGKTNSIRTLRNPLVLATELGDTQGLATLRDIDIPFVPIETWDQMVQVCAILTRDATYDGYHADTIVIDSLTACGDLWFDKGMDVLGFTELWAKGVGKDPRNVYAYVAEKGRQGMRMFFDIPANLVCLCREGLAEEGADNNKIQYAVPELPGAKLPRELPGWPDATLRGVHLNGQRLVQTQIQGKTVAGFRVPPTFDVPLYIKPDLQRIIEVITGDAVKALEALRPAVPTKQVIAVKTR